MIGYQDDGEDAEPHHLDARNAAFRKRAPGGERLYVLPAPGAATTILQRIRSAFDTSQESAGRARTYFDTFDRRMASEGCVLCLMEEPGGRALRWEELSGKLIRRLVTSARPTFARDLPEGPFRAALEPILDVRKLLPVAKVAGSTTRVCILDEDEKTTARVGLESWTLPAAKRGGRSRQLHLLRLSPVRGYARAEKKTIKILEQELDLRPLPPAALAEILGLAASVAPATGEWPPALTPEMGGDEAARVIYRSLLMTMRANEEGTRRRTDPEFLHEYRVALRRTRAGLSRLKGIFPQAVVDRFKREFSWLGQVTGPVRDIDVQILEVPSYETALPEGERAHLAPLRTWLAAEGEKKQAALVRALDSIRYKRLMAAWSKFLDGKPSVRSAPADAVRPVVELARERIWKLHRRIVRRGLRIDASTPAVEVHDLRLAAKKLRYLMEFFRTLFPAKQIKRQIQALKGLQEVLGRFNDFEVQQESLRNAALSMGKKGAVPSASMLVMGRLVESLQGRQDAARDEITGRVEIFARPENLARAERLFAPQDVPKNEAKA